MAYDWSGNDIKQKQYDRLIVAAVLTIVSVLVTTPFMLRFEGSKSAGTEMESRAPVMNAEPAPIRLARS